MAADVQIKTISSAWGTPFTTTRSKPLFAATLAFTMRLETLTGLMEDIDNYDGGFWILYDFGGNLIAEKNG